MYAFYSLTLKSAIGIKFLTPTSHISNTFPSNVRTSVMPLGRFLVEVPTTKKVASFFEDQNSNEEIPSGSNGWITFFLENEMACGRLSAIYVCQNLVQIECESRKYEPNLS
jgi:hypothetical protein